jgi:predicted metal-dependent hydrolase
MVTRLQLGDIAVDVVKKEIKNLHLSVYPPTGHVRISAPLRMNPERIRLFAISKIGWIRKQQAKLREQERETPREYLDRESHYVWGKRYLLKIVEREAAPSVELNHSKMLLRVRPGATEEKKEEIVGDWYREQVKKVAPGLIAKWERLMGVSVKGLLVRKMKTKWGSCSHKRRTIRLNVELGKKPPECLEYIIVHEMAHLLEPTHNGRFVELMDRFMPKWKFYRESLNRLPVRPERWGDH